MNNQQGDAGTATRERIIEAARELFWLQGYEATSVAEILEKAGAHSGSLYHFFNGKEELLLAVLDRYERLLDPVIVRPAHLQCRNGIEKVFRILQGYRATLLSSDFGRGCPIGNLALEVAETHPRARDGIRRNFAAWRAAIADCLRETAPDCPEDVDSERSAVFVLAVMEGAVMQTRVERDIGVFDQCMDELRQYFKTKLESAGSIKKRRGGNG